MKSCCLVIEFTSLIVAPRVGAWIEIVAGKNKFDDVPSLPVWGRGLK